jgi:hypothetical protein
MSSLDTVTALVDAAIADPETERQPTIDELTAMLDSRDMTIYCLKNENFNLSNGRTMTCHQRRTK